MAAPPPPPVPAAAPPPPAPPQPAAPSPPGVAKDVEALKRADKAVKDLELWSWNDRFLPKAMVEARKRAEKPLLDKFYEEELRKLQ
mmetsp:Transcript_9752/g.11217  ORF Transcript_9752/g.11217 Transcript_9752/m.11217 type:complete len:86 (+) Transcript_9752:203-460(+)|eukprot:CAMPEP_0204825568 /NCGR_PEP_ID=MMETSP1346-20131115/3433_1 /ASSEMBLY_ACC=CAM_ASM_000771 /TAXON_ID=215587 /ORGANISM="Aplanochytrium stocchinoi, Strain GSBS06" /LENGTH=85 /DNA_ID=CAMNT_0051953239 /DNA_START=465 /DNA_END=722 /DNA_ORIENTATION=+